MKKLIMLIDDDVTNLMTGRAALRGEYDVLTVDNGTRALELIEKKKPDLILLDIDMPDIDGYAVINRIKTNEKTADIPVIFLTALTGADNEYEGLSLGAADYITKPFNEKILKKRIETHLSLSAYTHNLESMVKEKTNEVMQLQDAILSTIAELVEFRDTVTGGHIDRTQGYMRIMVEEMTKRGLYKDAMSVWDTGLLIQSAQLHDVGKISVPDAVLNKPAKLDEDEYVIMKDHAIRGHEAIKRITEKVDESEFLYQAAIMAHTHHERWDGNGYPQGLKGEEIPLQGRLMAIVDVYDALISERPYKKAFTHDEAVHAVAEGAGTQFDPLLTELFIEIAHKFNELSTAEIQT